MTPQEFYDQIKDLKEPQAIESLCLELLNQIQPNWRDITPKTTQNKLAPYNKLLKEFPAEQLKLGENAFIYQRRDGSEWVRHLYFQYTGLTSDQWQNINQEGEKLKVTRLQNKAEIPVKQYLKVTEKLLTSSDPHELAVGLMAATGRRKTEILARGSFTLSTKVVDYLNPDYQLLFTGQLKKRDSDEPPFNISTLFPAVSVLRAWKRYRQTPECKQLLTRITTLEAEGKEPEVITKIISDQRSASINRVVNEYYSTFLPVRYGDERDSAHTLRAATAVLVTARDCPDRIDNLLFASWQLGHYINDEEVSNNKISRLLTSTGYMNYYVKTDVPFASRPASKEDKKAVRAYLSDYNHLIELQNYWELPTQPETLRKAIEAVEEVQTLKQRILELENQLANKNQEIAEKDKQIADMNTITPDLERLIENKIEESLNRRLPREKTESLSSKQAPIKSIEENVSETKLNQSEAIKSQSIKAKKPTNNKNNNVKKDWSLVSNKELFPSKEKGAADEKVRRAYQSIANYNDYKATGNQERWFISTRSLMEMSGCNYRVVKRWLEIHALSVNDHNSKYELSPAHNRTHKNTITEIIELWEPEEIND